MRIRILAIYLRGADAVGLQLTHWVRLLRDQGHDVAVYAEAVGADAPPDVGSLTTVVDGTTFHRSAYWQDVERADLVICDYPAYFGLAESLRLLTHTPVLWSYHGVTPPDAWLDDDGRRYLDLSRRRTGLVHFAGRATARSTFTRDELHALSGFPQDRIAVLPCIVPAPPATFRRSEDAAPMMLAVGRIAAHKRLDLLLDALAVVRREVPGMRLVLAGTTSGASHAPVVRRLRQRAEALGIADAVEWTGSIADDALEDLYGRATLMVNASAHEGFGVPVVEAMARGVPVVVTATAALPETVGDAGIVVADHDVGALAAAIARVAQDHVARADLIARGYARARRYQPDALAHQLAALVEQAAAQRQERPPRPRLRQVVDLRDLDAAAEVVPPSSAPRHTTLVSRGARALRRWFQSDLERQIDTLTQRQVAYNRQVARVLHALDEWTADASEQQAATQHERRSS